MLRPMLIYALAIDSLTESPIVILKEIDGERTLPIWIGILEANAIASELEGIKFSRPMTHDLLKNMMEMVDVKVIKIEVCDLKNNTYYALIHFKHGEKEMSIAELRHQLEQMERGSVKHNILTIELQRKFSIPSACFLLGLIGLPLGLMVRARARSWGARSPCGRAA